MAWSRAFQKCLIFHFLDKFCDKKFNFCKFLADFKRAQELSNASFVIFGHQTWDLEGGVKLIPPPAYSGFNMDRVNV